jgi:hypothetical protein
MSCRSNTLQIYSILFRMSNIFFKDHGETSRMYDGNLDDANSDVFDL